MVAATDHVGGGDLCLARLLSSGTALLFALGDKDGRTAIGQAGGRRRGALLGHTLPRAEACLPAAADAGEG